jgi:multidrug transporter EmrE-like cation transporter
MKLLLALLPTVVLVVYGQLVTKWRVAHLFDPLQNTSGRMDRLFVYLNDPYILSAYAAALAASVAWMFVIERHALSLAFPLYIGITVLSVVLGGVLLFGEQMNAMRTIAILLIVTGVALGSQS